MQCIAPALSNVDGPVRDIVLLNAAGASFIAPMSPAPRRGGWPVRPWTTGAAQRKLRQFITVTQALGRRGTPPAPEGGPSLNPRQGLPRRDARPDQD